MPERLGLLLDGRALLRQESVWGRLREELSERLLGEATLQADVHDETSNY